MDRPILILAMPRSGSSMTAGIFAKHGVWCGGCTAPNEFNAKGYFENKRLKRELIIRYGKLTAAGPVTDFEERPEVVPQDGFAQSVREIIRAEGYRQGPWLFKFSALYWRAFDDFDPLYVGVRRAGVADANLGRVRMFGTPDRGRVERMVRLHYDAIEASGAPVVDTDAVVRGDYGTLQSAFDHCGLPFEPEVADHFVDPALWHH